MGKFVDAVVEFDGKIRLPQEDTPAAPTVAVGTGNGLYASAAGVLNLAASGYKIVAISTTGIVSEANIGLAAAGAVFWPELSRVSSPENGKVRISNKDANQGVTLDATTADALRIQNHASDADGDLEAANTTLSGKLEASGGIGEFGAAPPSSQPVAIADVPTGGSATAAANATAVNSILAVLRARGTIAT